MECVVLSSLNAWLVFRSIFIMIPSMSWMLRMLMTRFSIELAATTFLIVFVQLQPTLTRYFLNFQSPDWFVCFTDNLNLITAGWTQCYAVSQWDFAILREVGEVLPQVTVEFEEAYAGEHLKQRMQVCLLFSGNFFWLSLLYNSSEDWCCFLILLVENLP